MKRWGYAWKAAPETQEENSLSTQDTQEALTPDDPALWGVDPEALKKSNTSLVSSGTHQTSTNLPIYRPEAPRAYLLKSFGTPPPAETEAKIGKPKPVSAKKAAEEKERNLGMLLAALVMLFRSWAETLSSEDMDRRAWGWYCAVRPEVEAGAAGWGGKGEVRLGDILKLRRQEG